jgi:uncharacterized membrane protein
MTSPLHQLRLRPRLMASLAFGAALALALPGAHGAVSRALLGWNAAMWLYLLLIARMMLRADRGHLRRVAAAQADGAGAMLGLIIAAAVASLAAIAFELAASRGPAGMPPSPQALALAVSTVVGSWILLPVEFALAYAGRYYSDPRGARGLCFPDEEAKDGEEAAQAPGPGAEPDYLDFMYFSFTIAATSQTSDVSVTTRAMRRLVLPHAVLSFGFNTVLLALTINIVAGLI